MQTILLILYQCSLTLNPGGSTAGVRMAFLIISRGAQSTTVSRRLTT